METECGARECRRQGPVGRLRSQISSIYYFVPPACSFSIVLTSQFRSTGSTLSRSVCRLAIVSPCSFSGMWWHGRVSCLCSLGTKPSRTQSPSGLHAQYFSFGQAGESSMKVGFRQFDPVSIQKSGWRDAMGLRYPEWSTNSSSFFRVSSGVWVVSYFGSSGRIRPIYLVLLSI
jgi:hypothetical protein